MKRNKLATAIATAVSSWSATLTPGQASLQSPSESRSRTSPGYEDWAVVSSARTDEVLKVIVANPTMIEAYKAGVRQRPAFPGWLQDREAPMEVEEEHGGPSLLDVPDVFTQAFVIEKDSVISEKRWMGIRAVQLRSRIRQVHGRSQPLRLRTHLPCSRKGEGPHLPPIPEALNCACRRYGGYAGSYGQR